jgi:hypothetical protein
MNPAEDGRLGISVPPGDVRSESAGAGDDPRLVQALEEYRAALDGGLRPDRQAFLAGHPAIAQALADCLDGLEFVHAAAPELSQDGAAAQLDAPVSAALAFSTVLIWVAKEDLNRANADLKQSLERERQNDYYLRIALAERELAANNLSRMQQLLDECPPELRGWVWHYLSRLRYKNLAPLRHEAAVFCAVFSPDGRRIAAKQ